MSVASLVQWLGPWTDQEYRETEEEATTRIHYVAEFDAILAPSEVRTVVLNLRQCPAFFAPLSSNTNLRVVGRQVSQNKDVPQAYDVHLDYSNKYSGSNLAPQARELSPKYEENPLLRPVKISAGYLTVREAKEFDLDSKPVLTTAGEPLLVDEEVSFRTFHFQKNVPDWDDVLLDNLRLHGGWNGLDYGGIDFINSQNFTIRGRGYPKHSLWLKDTAWSDIGIENGFFYYEFSCTIVFNPKLWIRKVRNQGYIRIKFIPNGQGRAGTTLVAEPIKIGVPPQFPSTPLPLRVSKDPLINGRLFPEYERQVEPLNPDTQQPWPVDNTNGIISAARQREIWEEATLEFRFREELDFNKHVPTK